MARVRKQVAAINVVPLIDVMLVLLVVFMITAPFINPGQVELPSVGKTAAPPTAPIEIILKADDTLILRDRADGGREETVTPETLTSAVQSRLQPEQAVVIAADKSVRYERVMDTMSALQQAGAARIGLLARPGP